jgi:RHS repeat-associated protein
VVLRASDPFGAFVTQRFTINVGAVHRPPVIASTPAGVTGTNSPYVYAVRVVNPENDPLSFSLSGAPNGMTIDPVTGILRWPTPVVQTLPYTLTIHVADTADPSGCAWSEQTYQLLVTTDPTSTDQPPVILTRPPDHVLTNTVYDFPIIASDPEGDNVTFSVTSNPNLGMSFPNNGAVLHLPSQTTTVTSLVTITAADAHGASQLTYTLTVGQASPPVFNPPLPPTPVQITGGLLYRYDAYVTGSGPFTYRFDVDASGRPVAPNGMTVDNLGRVVWRASVLHNNPPPADPPRDFSVRLIATDIYSQSTTLAFTIHVVPDTEPPRVSVRVSDNPNQDHPVFFYVNASDNVGVVSRRLQVDGADVPLESQHYAIVQRLSAGPHNMQGFATDAAGNEGTSGVQNFTVLTHGPTPPTVDFTPDLVSPLTVTQPIAVTGDASGNGQPFRWTLRLVPVAGGPSINLITPAVCPPPAGPDPCTNEVHGVLGTLDPTLVPDGPYYLQLHADSTGSDNGVEITVNVRGKLKLGDFKIAFTDLTVPVAGIPITVRRSYDSLQANSSRDLGYGWKLDFGDADLKVDFRNNPFRAQGQYPAFTTGEHIVVSREGADPEGFSFAPIHVSRFPLPDVYYPAFQADPGVTSQLVVQPAELTLEPTLQVYYSLDTGDQIFYNPANVGFGGLYHLITLDGIDHKIDAVSGKLLSLSDRHHNELTFARNGITSNRVLDGTPLGITFQRDGQGRIRKVFDPRGNFVEYGYDGHGDLYLVTDRLGQATQLAYDNSGQPTHRLITITDPLNQQPLQVTYNMTADHRLHTITDAAGKTTQLGYNASQPPYQQSITDPAQKTTTLTFDPRGNVTDVLDQAGQHTTVTYLGDSVASITQQNPGGSNVVTTFQYDDLVGGFSAHGLPARVIDGDNKTTSYSYNNFGQVQSVTDPLGHTVVNTYDPQTGDLLSVQPPATSPTGYLYDALGNVTYTSFGGATTTYQYDSVGRLTSTTSPTGVTRNTRYDRNGNRTQESFTWTDPDGIRAPRTLVTSMVYDANDRLTLTIDPESQQTQYLYDALNRVKQTTDIYGGVSATKYDKRGLVVEQTTPLGTVTRTAYDADGRVEYVTDAFVPGTPTNGTRNWYEAAGRVIKVERVENLVITVTADPSSTDVYTSARQLPVAQQGTSTGGNTSTTFNDTTKSWTAGQWIGRQVEIKAGTGAGQARDIIGNTPNQLTLPAATPWTTVPDTTSAYTINERVYSRTQTSYNALGQVQETIDPAGLDTTFQYNGRGLQTLETVVIAGTPYNTRTDYDDAGRATQVTDRASHLTTTMYDAAGRVTQVTYADNKSTQNGYDPQGRKQSQTDELRRTTTFMYDSVGRLRSVTQPVVLNPETGLRVSPVTSYDYDIYGNLKKITDAKSRQTTFAYDEYNRQVKRTLPDASFETTVYNGLGQLFQHIDFKGQKTEYVYDPGLNRVHLKNLYAVGTSTPTDQVQYAYDTLGRIQTVTQPNSQQTVYAYGADSRLQTLTTPQGPITYGYDEKTGRHTETTTSNSDFVYGYDVFGHLQTVSVNKRDGVVLSTPELTTYTWDPVGTLNNVQHPTGITTVYGYDLRYRVQSMVQQQGTGQLAKYVYGRQDDGKITHVNEYGTDPTTPTIALDYVYDELGRLTRECTNAATGACATGPGDHTDYSLDLVGNRLTKTKVTGSLTETTTWRYNARDEIIDQVFSNGGPSQTTVFGYDANGSLISQSLGSQSTTYDYNLENRLKAAHLPGGVNTAYLYNDDGLRVQEVNGADVKNLLVDGNNPTGYAQVMEERNADGSLRATYVYGLEALEESQAGTVSYYLTDAHSGVRILTSASGAVLNTDRYDGFGNLLTSTGSAVNPLLYRGYRFDVTTGFYTLGVRPYSASVGAFVQQDPVLGSTSFPLTLPRYFYAAADPINYTDPNGTEFGLAGSLLSTSIRLAITGSLLSVGINGINNVALGRSFFDGAAGAAAFGAAALPLAVAFPVVGIVLAGIGIYGSGTTAWRVFTNPDSSAGQRGAAAFLVGLSVFGAVGAGRSAQARGLWVNARYLETAGLSSANSMSRALDYALYRTKQFKNVLDTMPRRQQNSITIGVGVADDPGGIRHTLIATSEPRGYIRPPMQRLIQGEDIIVRGDGDAEANIVAYANSRGWNLIGVGATRHICDDCAAHIAEAGATAVTPLRNP